MKHRINPLVDCVFKDLFGAEENVDLLAHFLNAVLAPAEPLVELVLENPYVPAETPTDDYRVVDVRARDRAGRIVQIEVQLFLHPHLRERLVYGWADLYQGQLQRGGRFGDLRPVISVWIIDRELLRGDARWHNRFQLRDAETGERLSDHVEIHTLELRKLAQERPEALDDAARWAYFLREARHWDALPAPLSTPELRKAMSIIQRWSEKDEDYRAYQNRMTALRVKAEMEHAQRETEAALARLEAEKAEAEAEKAQAEAEAERLRALLRAAGLDPDAPRAA